MSFNRNIEPHRQPCSIVLSLCKRIASARAISCKAPRISISSVSGMPVVLRARRGLLEKFLVTLAHEFARIA